MEEKESSNSVSEFRIDRNRVHTEAEVELVMELFSCSRGEARKILNTNVPLDKFAEFHGMIDAALLDLEIARGRKVCRPGWLDNAQGRGL